MVELPFILSLYEVEGSEVRRRRVNMDYGILDSHTLCVCNDNVYWSNRLSYVCILYSRTALIWKRILKADDTKTNNSCSEQSSCYWIRMVQ